MSTLCLVCCPHCPLREGKKRCKYREEEMEKEMNKNFGQI